MDYRDIIIAIIALIGGGGFTALWLIKANTRKAHAEAKTQETHADSDRFEIESKRINQLMADVEHERMEKKKAYAENKELQGIIDELRREVRQLKDSVFKMNLRLDSFERYLNKAYNCKMHTKSNPCPVLQAYLESEKPTIE